VPDTRGNRTPTCYGGFGRELRADYVADVIANQVQIFGLTRARPLLMLLLRLSRSYSGKFIRFMMAWKPGSERMESKAGSVFNLAIPPDRAA
jgi:hypothetical protein